jgi:hypothetical protein
MMRSALTALARLAHIFLRFFFGPFIRDQAEPVKARPGF